MVILHFTTTLSLQFVCFHAKSLWHIQRFMRDMCQWHMMSTWKRCPGSNSCVVSLISFSFLYSPSKHHVNLLLLWSRNGEWGDHVTLQAAVDSVGLHRIHCLNFLSTKFFLVICQYILDNSLGYLLLYLLLQEHDLACSLQYEVRYTWISSLSNIASILWCSMMCKYLF